MKTVKIYDSCLNTSAIESRGNSPLKKMIEKYGGWSVSGNGSNSWSVEEKMGRVLRDLNVQTLLQVTVGTDLEDSSKHILNVSITMVFSHTSYHTKAFFLLCGLFPKLIHTSLTWDRQVQFRRLFFCMSHIESTESRSNSFRSGRMSSD